MSKRHVIRKSPSSFSHGVVQRSLATRTNPSHQTRQYPVLWYHQCNKTWKLSPTTTSEWLATFLEFIEIESKLTLAMKQNSRAPTTQNQQLKTRSFLAFCSSFRLRTAFGPRSNYDNCDCGPARGLSNLTSRNACVATYMTATKSNVAKTSIDDMTCFSSDLPNMFDHIVKHVVYAAAIQQYMHVRVFNLHTRFFGGGTSDPARLDARLTQCCPFSNFHTCACSFVLTCANETHDGQSQTDHRWHKNANAARTIQYTYISSICSLDVEVYPHRRPGVIWNPRTTTISPTLPRGRRTLQNNTWQQTAKYATECVWTHSKRARRWGQSQWTMRGERNRNEYQRGYTITSIIFVCPLRTRSHEWSSTARPINRL